MQEANKWKLIDGFTPEIVVTAILTPIIGYMMVSSWNRIDSWYAEYANNKVVRQRSADEIRYRTCLADDLVESDCDEAREILDGGDSERYIYPEYQSVRLFGLLRSYQEAGGELPRDDENNDPLEIAKFISSKKWPTEGELGVILKHLKRVFGDDCD